MIKVTTKQFTDGAMIIKYINPDKITAMVETYDAGGNLEDTLIILQGEFEVRCNVSVSYLEELINGKRT